MITILLCGAPEGMEPVFELDALTLPERVSVPYYGCHQHFERADDVVRFEGRSLPVFRFTYRTAIAE
ncbi:DUF5988 family protein [Streptomyces sp. NPDC050658]|uniref:DUF5988 family protein n=1 Tax=unclassified Streptomyces TaxID=2593676 RepID=UPI00343B9BF7